MTTQDDTYATAAGLEPFEAPEPAGLEPAPLSLADAAVEQPAVKARQLPGRRASVILADPATGDFLEPFEVRIDNRDYLRWDKTAPRQGWVKGGKDAPPVPPFLMATFLAWSAATRSGLTTLTWAQFEANAVQVENHTEEDEDRATPTR